MGDKRRRISFLGHSHDDEEGGVLQVADRCGQLVAAHLDLCVADDVVVSGARGYSDTAVDRPPGEIRVLLAQSTSSGAS